MSRQAPLAHRKQTPTQQWFYKVSDEIRHGILIWILDQKTNAMKYITGQIALSG